MSISSVGPNSSNTLFTYLNSSASGNDASDLIDDGSSTVPSVQPPVQTAGEGPEGFLANELQEQGYSGTDLSDLLEKVKDAVNEVRRQSGDSRPHPVASHDADTNVLKDAGVDTDKIDQDFIAAHPYGGHHHHGGGAGGVDGDQTQQDGSLDDILQALGVDPAKFKSALQDAINNPGEDGSLDLSQLFSSAAVGSQLDVTG
jgi:hypothetical protein